MLIFGSQTKAYKNFFCNFCNALTCFSRLEISRDTLIRCHFCAKIKCSIIKMSSASGGQSPPDPPPGALPLDPTGGSAPRPPIGSRSTRSPFGPTFKIPYVTPLPPYRLAHQRSSRCSLTSNPGYTTDG